MGRARSATSRAWCGACITSSGISPFDLLRIGDCGDAPVNPLDLDATLRSIADFYREVVAGGAAPLTAGGDHLVSLPILRAVAKDGPLGFIQFDAHTDTYDSFFGNRYNHGTPFRRAIEEGLLDPKRMVQIGIARRDLGRERTTTSPGPRACASCSSRSFRSAARRDVMAEARRDRRATARPTSRSTSTRSIRPSRPAPARRRSAA